MFSNGKVLKPRRRLAGVTKDNLTISRALPRKMLQINFLFCINELKFSLKNVFYLTLKTKKTHSFY